MKKAESVQDELRAGYRREDFPKGLVRGKYAARAAAASNIAVLEPEVAAAFPNSAAVNTALRTLLKAARQAAPAS
jgi:hypothetical protein